MNRFRLFLILVILGLYAGAGTRRVLFIGNSYTSVNNLPLLLDSVSRSAGDTVVYSSNTPGGYTFQLHSTNAATLALIAQGNWDVVVLQEQSQRPSFPDGQVQAEVFPYARRLDSLIHISNPCATTLFYRTWGRKNGDASNCANFPPLCTYAGMDSLLHLRYRMMADSNRAELCPAGQVWKRIRRLHPGIELYQSDESHPSLSGSYVTACAFYASIFRKNPELVSYNPGLPDSVWQVARESARLVVFDSLLTWNTGRWDVRAGAIVTSNGNYVTLQDTSAEATTITWNMGDGTLLTGTQVQHTYAQFGVYVVMQVAANACASDTAYHTLVSQGVGVKDIGADESVVWNSPAPGQLLVQIKNSQAKGELFDALGRSVTAFAKQQQGTLQWQGLAAGWYVFKQQMPNGKILSRKMVVH